MRTIVDLPETQIKELAELGKQTQLSRAELLRRAVADYLVRHQPQPSDEAFGLWQAHSVEGLSYQEKMRSEWD